MSSCQTAKLRFNMQLNSDAKSTRWYAKQSNSRRTVIESHKGDKRYVRRDGRSRFKTEVNVGRSLAADRRRKAKTESPKGARD
jgi:hypothetical protein